jgi:FkbM family methyltransferase
VGANIGFTALIAKLVNPEHPVILVEPNKEALSWAIKNLIYNNLTNNLYFESVLLGDCVKNDVEFFTIGVGAAGSIHSSNAETANVLRSSSFIPMTTLDNLVQKYNMVPDFVKIDVEGAEILVLNGSMKLAQSKKTKFLVEMHHSVTTPMRENADKVLLWCKAMDFKAWYLKDKTELLTPQSIAHRGRCHLLLQPSNWPFPEYLLKVNEGDSIESHFNR